MSPEKHRTKPVAVKVSSSEADTAKVVTGAEHLPAYLPLLEGKQVALVANHSSLVNKTHLLDTLLGLEVDIRKIFTPEHGFRGLADPGAFIDSGRDLNTGVPIVSLYGKHKKPSPEDLSDVEIVVFDIQDVGARFYTYISTMHLVMEACAENEVPLLILDRPNPNGHYVDGPVLQQSYQSFVGMHPVPVVHGMTVGEYASMINGERWLSGGIRCNLKVIPCMNYTHGTFYRLPVKPSPNLPNMRSILLYPSLCFFEGTTVSVGRGTDRQFQIYGHPDFKGGDYSFIPMPAPGAMHPRHEGQTCYGYDLTSIPVDSLYQMKALNLSFVIDYYEGFPDSTAFFLENKFFDKLAGGSTLREQITDETTIEAIRASWKKDLEIFLAIRKKYLIYD